MQNRWHADQVILIHHGGVFRIVFHFRQICTRGRIGQLLDLRLKVFIQTTDHQKLQEKRLTFSFKRLHSLRFGVNIGTIEGWIQL